MTVPLEVLTPATIAGLHIRKVQAAVPQINLLVYGPSGIGKTRFMGTADDVPEMRKILFVDFEGGTLTLRASNPQVDVVRITEWKEVTGLYNELRAMKHGYNTVVIDSLTEVAKFNLYHVLGMRVEEREQKGEQADPDIADMRAWQRNTEHMRRFVRLFRDLPMNVLFTALERQDKDQKTGTTTKLPSLSGKLAGEVAAFLDMVFYMYKKEVTDEQGETVQRRLMLTSATETITAKDRSAKLPVVMEDPTMTYVYDKIIGQPTDIQISKINGSGNNDERPR